MFAGAPQEILDQILAGADTVPALLAQTLGAGSVCKQLRRACLERKTALDGSVRSLGGNWFRIRGGASFEERHTEGDELKEPYTLIVVRDDSPGRPVRILLVGDDEIRAGLGVVQRAYRISASAFVSVFSTKDAHRQIWRAREMSNTLREFVPARDVARAMPTPLPVVGVCMSMWPSVLPDLRIKLQDGCAGWELTGKIALHVPLEECDEGGADNRPAVFDRVLLIVAGLLDPPETLNRVPGVLSVDTPAPEREPCTTLARRDPPPKRSSAEAAGAKMRKDTNILNATSQSGAMSDALKPSIVQEYEASHSVIDARFADMDDEEDEIDEGDLNDADYRPGRRTSRHDSGRAVRRRGR